MEQSIPQSFQVSLFALLRTEPSFRRLWIGQSVSEIGDWLQLVAILSILPTRGHAALGLGGFFFVRFLPSVLVAPLAGSFADRFPRGRIMIVADLLRAALVLGYLRVRGPEDLPLVYVLSFLQESVTAFFEPARGAAIAQMVPREKLLSANALSSMSWSVMLSIGAWLGGMITSAAGPRAAFVVDAATFLISAVYIFRARVPPMPKREPGHAASGSFLEGLRYLRAHPPQAVIVLLKGGLGVVGGFGVLLSSFADQVLGGDLARSTGWLYFARGLGALLGPLVAKRFFGDSPRSLRRGLLLSFPLAAASLVGFAHAPGLGAACFAFLLTTTGTSIVWVHSTQLLQLTVEARVLGRVLAVELAVLTSALAASTALVAVPMARGWLDPRGATLLLAASMLVPAVAWALANARWGDAIDRAVHARDRSR